MRQIQIMTDPSRANAVASLARDCGAVSVAVVSGRGDGDREISIIAATVPNAGLGRLIEETEGITDEADFVFQPTGAIALSTPLKDVADIVRAVEPRSPLELVVGSLQSLGGWRGMLTYSAFSGIVAAYAVLFDLSYLLVAAMLIAPVGAPAMVTVAGATLGDPFMIRRGAIRFFAAVGTLALTAIALGQLYGMSVSTATMESITGLSRWTALIALAGGAAGAAAQVRSSRDSLVTGTATGFLIAVSLSPPAAVLGLALTIQRWDYVGQMALNLVLMYAGIVVGGSIMLLFHGVHPGVTAAHRGTNRVRTVAMAVAVLILVGLMTLQAGGGVAYAKADAAHRSLAAIRDAVGEVSGVRLVDATTSFTRQDIVDGESQTMYVQIVAEPLTSGDPALTAAIRTAVENVLEERMPDVLPYIDVSLVESSGRAAPAATP